MLPKLKEEDFEVLRGPLESGRQSPSSLGSVLILSVFIQALLFALVYFVAAATTIYPYKDEILTVYFWLTLLLIMLSLIYAVPAIYNRSGTMQYFILILVTQNMSSIPFLLMSLFLLGKAREGMIINPESLLHFTYSLLFIGFLIFVAICIRFYSLLRRGHYRKGSQKGELRRKFEVKSYIPAATIAGIGIVFIIQYIVQRLELDDANNVILIFGGILTYFVILFIFPGQLIVLYCKFIYKSFTFNERGYLNSRDS